MRRTSLTLGRPLARWGNRSGPHPRTKRNSTAIVGTRQMRLAAGTRRFGFRTGGLSLLRVVCVPRPPGLLRAPDDVLRQAVEPAAWRGAARRRAAGLLRAGAAGPSSTTSILGYFLRALPDSNEICCMSNHQRRLALPRPTAAPTATQLRVVLTLRVLPRAGTAEAHKEGAGPATDPGAQRRQNGGHGASSHTFREN